MHRINFPFLGFFFFFLFMKWLQHACAWLSRKRVARKTVAHCPIPAQWPFQTHLTSPFSVFAPFQGSQGNQELVAMEVGRYLPPATSTALSVFDQGDKDGLVNMLCTITCRRASMKAYFSQVMPVTEYVSGMARTLWGMPILAIPQWVPSSI